MSVILAERRIPELLPLGTIARKLRVPAGWLKSEAAAGRIPHIPTGRQHLGRLDVIERVLAERAGARGGWRFTDKAGEFFASKDSLDGEPAVCESSNPPSEDSSTQTPDP